MNQIVSDLEEELALDRQISLAKEEAHARQSATDQAEAKYATYREGIMSRMMDAARAGESIDLEEAGRLIEFEVNRNLSVEKFKQAKLEVDELMRQKEMNKAGAATAYVNCTELEILQAAFNEAEQHLRDVICSLDELSIEKSTIDDEIPGNALDQFSVLIDSYSVWIGGIRALESDDATIEIQKQRLGLVCDITTIDSTTLFSEICITLASRQHCKKFAIPDQDPFTGDFTEY